MQTYYLAAGPTPDTPPPPHPAAVSAPAPSTSLAPSPSSFRPRNLDGQLLAAAAEDPPLAHGMAPSPLAPAAPIQRHPSPPAVMAASTAEPMLLLAASESVAKADVEQLGGVQGRPSVTEAVPGLAPGAFPFPAAAEEGMGNGVLLGQDIAAASQRELLQANGAWRADEWAVAAVPVAEAAGIAARDGGEDERPLWSDGGSAVAASPPALDKLAFLSTPGSGGVGAGVGVGDSDEPALLSPPGSGGMIDVGGEEVVELHDGSVPLPDTPSLPSPTARPSAGDYVGAGNAAAAGAAGGGGGQVTPVSLKHTGCAALASPELSASPGGGAGAGVTPRYAAPTAASAARYTKDAGEHLGGGGTHTAGAHPARQQLSMRMPASVAGVAGKPGHGGGVPQRRHSAVLQVNEVR
ncbi:hypothetical protein GPECTOR_30g142 [Gonium pectorale]|uniref:Uncharacterized protein n=1 Tax=Gonium pectorale TaxID=33097 RepID=A0A150GDX7_GONPE|nr:hypothetical protein GPECTOR_30g142 [Gonium pectorale]|eukprot:KXZ48047.1 hypothetical protein GPECTOR_30g142 [Gonium pectorale]